MAGTIRQFYFVLLCVPQTSRLLTMSPNIHHGILYHILMSLGEHTDDRVLIQWLLSYNIRQRRLKLTLNLSTDLLRKGIFLTLHIISARLEELNFVVIAN